MSVGVIVGITGFRLQWLRCVKQTFLMLCICATQLSLSKFGLGLWFNIVVAVLVNGFASDLSEYFPFRLPMVS